MQVQQPPELIPSVSSAFTFEPQADAAASSGSAANAIARAAILLLRATFIIRIDELSIRL